MAENIAFDARKFILAIACAAMASLCLIACWPAQAQALDNSGIVLIDTGVGPEEGVTARLSVLGDDGSDTSGHGTAMLQAIREANPSAQVTSIKAFDAEGRGSRASVYAALVRAIGLDPAIVVLSFSGYAPEGDVVMDALASRAASKGITLVAAAGNQGADAALYSPARIKSVITVGALGEDGEPLPTSNRGDCVNAWETASSTSQAAAYHAGRLSLAGARPGTGGSPDSYTVVFDANGGMGRMEALAVGGPYELPECGFFFAGKELSGWSTSPDGRGRFVPDRQYVDFLDYVYDWNGLRIEANLEDAIGPSGVLTLYAQWEREPLAAPRDYLVQWGWDYMNSTWLFQCRANSLYMHRNSTENGANVRTAAFDVDDNRKYQQWRLVYDFTHRILAANKTSMAVDIAGTRNSDGANVCMWKRDDAEDGQHFFADPSSDGDSSVGNTNSMTWFCAKLKDATYNNDMVVEVNMANNNVQIWTQADSDRYSHTPSGGLGSHGSKTKNRQWKAIRATYTVKYNGNGSTSGSMSNQSHFIDDNNALSANEFARKYTVTYDANGGQCSTKSATAPAAFNGWATSASGNKKHDDKAIVQNLSTCHKATVNLYANWTLGSVKLPTPTRTGCIFSHWSTSATGGSSVGTAGAKYTPTANVTLYAHWIPQATITYHANGGTISDAPHQYDSSNWFKLASSKVVKSSSKNGTYSAYTTVIDTNTAYKNLPNVASTAGITKAGYHVNGKDAYFNTKADGTGVPVNADNTAAGDKNPVTTKRLNGDTQITAPKNFTLYVQWAPNKYTVKYDGNGATGGSTADSSHTYNTAKALTANGFTKLGYSFQGWSASNSAATATYANSASVLNLTKTNGGIVQLYAVWKVNQHDISYNLAGGSFGTGASHPSKATYNAAFTVSNPVRNGYRFDGWTITGMDSCTHYIGGATTTATSFGPTKEQSYKNLRATPSTVTYTANWTPVTNLRLHVDDTSSVWRTIQIVNNGGAISVPGSATNDARKSNCHRADGTQGLDAWYEDANYLRPYSPRALPLGDYDLYARNWSCITLAHGEASRPDIVYTGADNGLSGDIATASGTPRTVEVAYGRPGNLPEPSSRRVTYDAGNAFPSTLRAETGWHSGPDLAGAAVTRWTSSGDATLYKKWAASITDGAQAGRG